MNKDSYAYLRNDRDEAFGESYPVYYSYITEDYILSLPECEQCVQPE